MAKKRLQGVFEQALSGMFCLRGYAEMQELKNISYSPKSYQRDKDDTQLQSVTQYLSNGKDLFFPEIILACKIPTYDSQSGTDLLKALTNRESINIKDFTISIPKNGLTSFSFDEKIKLSRIDGNHRLSAFKQTDVIASYIAPFCILFLFDDNAGQKLESIFFYNINFKHLPLKHEHSLKILINPELNFSDEELKSMGWEYYTTRVLCKRIEEEGAFQHINLLSADSDCFRSTIYTICSFLISKKLLHKQNADFEKITKALNVISAIYEKFGDNNKGSIGLLCALVYFELKDKKISSSFHRWIFANHIYKIEKIDASDLVTLFERIMLAKSRQIFVSMQFDEETKPHYAAIKEAVQAINDKYKLEITLKQIRIDEQNKGYSFVINDEILNLINESGLLIADLTPRNPNVYHELGFLMGLNQARTLQQENFILIMKNQPDGETDAKVGFNVRGYQQIRFSRDLELKNKLIESLEIYYGIKAPIEEKAS